MYQHLSAKSVRQILTRAGNFLDLPARRAGNVLHLVSNADYNCTHFDILAYMGLVDISNFRDGNCRQVHHMPTSLVVNEIRIFCIIIEVNQM